MTMKFDFCIGNPPYQETVENTSDKPIYNDFMDSAYKIADKVELITPARFLFNAGKTPKEWNRKMLSDENLKVLSYVRESKDVFPNTSINGGIVITYRDASKKFGSIGYFCADEEIRTVAEKVTSAAGFQSLKEIVYLQNKFDLDELYKDFPLAKEKISSNGNEKRIVSSAFENLDEVFTIDSRSSNDVQICGLYNRKRINKYVNRKYLEDRSNLDAYKVLLSAADGASGVIGKPIPARIIGSPAIIETGVGYTQTFISIGAFPDKNQAENLYKYLQTKFARFMVGTIKVTNGLKIEVWSNVPMQDFTETSDICWHNKVEEIDKQLYTKYGLTEDEIRFIEKHIKEMA